MRASKKVEIPDHYLTNSLIEIKRAALVNLDINLLRKIKSFEAERVYHYSRLNEDCIRDREGNIIESETLPFPQITTWKRLWPIEYGKMLFEHKLPAGGLFSEINNQIDLDEYETIILEIPDEIVFPILDNFDWKRTCYEWAKANGYMFNVSLMHRLDGLEFYKLHRNSKNKTTADWLAMVKVDSMTEEQIEEYKKEHNIE